MDKISPFSLVFAPMHNTKGRKDGDEFKRQAKAFIKQHDLKDDCLHIIDNRKSKSSMRAAVLDGIQGEANTAPEEYRAVVAFFCHGYKRGIQFGYDLRTVHDLAEAIMFYGGRDVVVPLYACDTARDVDRDRRDDLRRFGGDGGFADELRDSLCEAGSIWCRVDAHTTAGHTTRNPNVRRFNGDGSMIGGKGGFYPVPRPERGDKKRNARWRAWRADLRTPYRFFFPLMSTTEIYEHLLNPTIVF